MEQPAQPSPAQPSLLKRVLIDYANHATDMKVFMYTLFKSEVFIPSETTPTTDLSDLKPIILDHQGTPMVCLFTDIQLTRPYTDTHPYILTVDARAFLSSLAPDIGITLDHGYDKPFQLMPQVIPAALNYMNAKLAEPRKTNPDGPAAPDLTDPENSLEQALLACADNVISLDTLVACLLRSPIYIASATPVEPTGRGLSPLVFDRHGTLMMSTHSSFKRAQDRHPDAADIKPFAASAVLQNFPPDHGIVLNLGYAQMLELPPDFIASIKQQLANV